ETVTRTITTPDQKQRPSASCQENPSAPTTTNATYAFISRPGATANGRRAQRPIARVARADAATVAKNATLLGTPPSARMPGLTTKMYESARKVDVPARTSRDTVLPLLPISK